MYSGREREIQRDGDKARIQKERERERECVERKGKKTQLRKN